MSPPLRFLSETHLIGENCAEHMIDEADFPILRNAPFRWVGWSELKPPYRLVRRCSVHSHIVVCLRGRGRALVGDQVREWRPGQVLLAPVGVHHAFEIAGAGPWKIAWVFFNDSEAAPALPRREVQLIESSGQEFAEAVRLLVREAAGPADPAVMEGLVAALNGWARRLTGSNTGDPRLWQLWADVEKSLSHAWTLAELAGRVHVSEEHLRRLCQRHLQCSPAEHLAHLRLRRAATLLRSSARTLEDIALQVGYGSVYSFSVAFKRWSGSSPGRFRGRAVSSPSVGLA